MGHRDDAPTVPNALRRSSTIGIRRLVVCVPLLVGLIAWFATATSAGAAESDLTSISRIEERTFYSRALSRSMPYFIYLPPGYDANSDRYPVVYLLHGLGGSNHEWMGYGALAAADELIKSGQIAPMLIVLPEAGHQRGRA